MLLKKSWVWIKAGFYYLVVIVLLLVIYTEVIQTRFECVIFSVAALIYFELIASFYGLKIEILVERDHRNEIYRGLSKRLGAPVEPELDKAIEDLKGQTEKASLIHYRHGLARFAIILVILWNLFRTIFFWPSA